MCVVCMRVCVVCCMCVVWGVYVCHVCICGVCVCCVGCAYMCCVCAVCVKWFRFVMQVWCMWCVCECVVCGHVGCVYVCVLCVYCVVCVGNCFWDCGVTALLPGPSSSLSLPVWSSKESPVVHRGRSSRPVSLGRGPWCPGVFRRLHEALVVEPSPHPDLQPKSPDWWAPCRRDCLGRSIPTSWKWEFCPDTWSSLYWIM